MGQHLLVWGLKDILVQKIRNLTCEQFGGQTQTDAILKKMHRVDPKDQASSGLIYRVVVLGLNILFFK